MSSLSKMRDWLAETEAQSTVRGIAYGDRRASLSRLNLLTVLLPALLSTAAAVLAAVQDQPKIDLLVPLPAATVLSALAAVLITFHKTLKCDDYQAECLRLSQAYQAIAASAGAALALPDDQLSAAHDRLSNRLDQLTDGAKATVPERYLQRARAKWSERESFGQATGD